MEKLIEMLEDLNPDVDFSTEEKLIDGGLLDSMAILSLVSDLEDEFDVEIPDEEIEHIRTVGELVSYIEENM